MGVWEKTELPTIGKKEKTYSASWVAASLITLSLKMDSLEKWTHSLPTTNYQTLDGDR